MPLWTARSGLTSIALGFSLSLSSKPALAQEPPAPTPTAAATGAPAAVEVPPAAADSEAPPPPPPPKPTQYSLPFQLRPVMVATLLRLDSSFASYDHAFPTIPGKPTATPPVPVKPGFVVSGAFAAVSELHMAFRIPGTGNKPGTGLAPLARLTVVGDSIPSNPRGLTGGFAIVNPLVGAIYALDFGSGFRGSAGVGFTIPIGMGGGDHPDARQKDARSIGPFVRANMDNGLFAVNDLAIIPCLDFAYVAAGFTAQIEAGLFQLERVRGSLDQPEAQKTNFTSGVHAGYFVTDWLSIGAELRYQRWTNAPLAVDQKKPDTSVDMTSVGGGPRFHLKAGSTRIRPGLAFTRGFDHPMTSSGNYNIVQLDIPVVF
jgi:hypothetical protein